MRAEPHPYVRYLNQKYGTYRKFLEEEGLPVIEGHYVKDVRTLPLKEWPRKGGYGAIINLSDQSIDDAYVCEIPPGKSLKPQRCLYEELIYILSGIGATTVRYGKEREQVFEWKEGSVFAVPLNCPHQHFNADGARPARYLAVTSAPLMMNLFNDLDFIFNNDFRFGRRYAGEEDYFRKESFVEGIKGGLWETNFIADIRAFMSPQRLIGEWRGKKMKHTYISMASNVMKTHVAQFEVGTYKKAHRHGPGAHIYILNGSGYTLMWPSDEAKKRYDWHEGSLLSPPAGWYHQHFNTGPEPVRHLAFHRPAVINYGKWEGREEIPYEEEEPEVREMFEAELARVGIASGM
ncbi:MAG: cupin domain-containing protein [Deltaproteobacteria bacterium]|nr:cupin domain-containing protein [Deltaproteobacteria bacterium]